MPSAELIIWTAISGLILIMLAIIGYLIKTGFESIKTELKTLWDKLDNDHTGVEVLKTEFREHKARCEERRTQRRNEIGEPPPCTN
jgi:hypothetical protein